MCSTPLVEFVNAKKESLENSPYVLVIELITQILHSKNHLSSQVCLILLTLLELVQDTANFLLLGNRALCGGWSLSSFRSPSHSFIHSFDKYSLSATLCAWNTEGTIQKHGPCPLAAFSQKKTKQIINIKLNIWLNTFVMSVDRWEKVAKKVNKRSHNQIQEGSPLWRTGQKVKEKQKGRFEPVKLGGYGLKLVKEQV